MRFKKINLKINKIKQSSIIPAVFSALILVVCISLAIIESIQVKADDITSKGIISPGTTSVRIRETPDTSTSDNIITKVNGGFMFDIYSTENTDEEYEWYRVGFYLDNEYRYGYIYGKYVTVLNQEASGGMSDEEFDQYLEDQNFPESYRDDLRTLHKIYPNWIFKADHLDTDWNEMLENQNELGRSLISYYSESSWKSIAEGAYNWETGEWVRFDSGAWVQASSELVQYAMDPRNFLNEKNIFMFEKLSYDPDVHTEQAIANVISNSFMNGSSHDLGYQGTDYNYVTGLKLAAEVSGVSPTHLATRIIQEQGRNGDGQSISGNVNGYEGYFNYYNQWAYRNGNISAVVNGLINAQKTDSETLRPWDSRMKSIVGGAIKLGKGYINVGQDTLYYEKFDVNNYWHQYMTHIIAARSESVIISGAYSEDTKYNNSFEFVIPVYKNMPEQTCQIPTGSGSPNYMLSDLTVDGYSLTPTFSRFTDEYDLIVENVVSSVNISATAADSNAQVDGMGRYDLSIGTNRITVTVTAQNGGQKRYYINIVRKDMPQSPEPEEGLPSFTTQLNINNEKKLISGIGIESNAADVLKQFNCTGGAYVQILNENGSQNNGTIATGNRVVIYDSNNNELYSYDVVIYGDANGDGFVDIMDIVRIRRYLLDMIKQTGCYLEAMDANRDTSVDIMDIVRVRNYLLGRKFIQQ